MKIVMYELCKSKQGGPVVFSFDPIKGQPSSETETSHRLLIEVPADAELEPKPPGESVLRWRLGQQIHRDTAMQVYPLAAEGLHGFSIVHDTRRDGSLPSDRGK